MKDHANRTNIFGRARMLFMALLMVLTMTATAMSGTDAYAANDTVYVATYDQLRVALEDTPGVKEVVVDPQAAVEEGEVVYGVEDDENSDAFYIGFDGPLTVSHDITITSADDVDVYFARSDSFRRDQGKPALLNIDSTGNLNLDGLITMTGEEVATTFYEADEENPAEFVFSVKSKDGTGEDNEVWNRGQALQGGFYIQNNGGEYTLGDDVIMEDINLADDVEGVEQIHEVEKTTLRSLFSSNKGDEEVVEEEAVEEKAAEEEATQEEEVVVAPTPKRLMKNSLMSNTPTRGDTAITSFADLKTAIEAGTSPIILDAVFTKGGKNYFPISEPLTVKKNVVIQTKDNKEIILARSDKFKPEPETPAMFNVVSGGDLTLSNQVVMSGIEVKMPEKVNVKLSTGNAYLGIGKYGVMDQLKAVSSGAKEFSVNNGGFLTYYDGTKTCTFRYNFLTSDQNNAGEQDFRVKAVKKDGTLEEGYVTSLEEGKTYVAVVKILKYRPDNTTYYEENYMTSDGNSLSISTDRKNAVTFTATPSGGQNNVNYVVNPKTGDEAWTNEDVLPGGYFIHATGGGKVTLNSGVSLQDLNTAADVPNAAPVYVGGQGSKLDLKGAEIKNNLVGYAGGDETNSKKMVKDYNQYDIEEFVEGTKMTNSVGGIILDNKATAEFTSGKVNSNRADVGAVLVKNNAELEISGTEEGTTINGNVGFHHAGAVQVESGGKVRMTGGTMSDNVAWYKGGAVWATEWGTNGYAKLNWNTKPFPTLENPNDRKDGGYFSMAGGSLKNNMAFKRAGAIEVESNNVYLKSGEISGNTTRSLGGAIYVEGDNTTYTYTLVIEDGYIGNNKAVKPGTNGEDNNKINRYLDGTGKLTEASSSNPSSHDHDFSYWGAAGNGGGVWLCPRGGTASFTGQNVIIDNNTKERNGTDLFLQPGYGSVMLQDMKGFWKNENTNKQIATNGVYNGPLPLQNYGASASGPAYSEPSSGLIIKNNLARDGGGIAANGTVIFGSAKDEFRYDARVNIHKTWDSVPVAQREDINIQVGYGDPSTDEFNILNTTLIKGNDASSNPQNIELTLDGTSGDIGNYSDAVAGETSTGVGADEWTGYVTIPAAINGVALYKFERPAINKLTSIPDGKFTAEEIAAYNSKTELDPSKPSDLKYLYYIAKYHRDLLKVKAGTSKIKIRETNTKYDKTYNLNLTVDNIELTERPTTLIEPASGTQHASFNTCFTSISVGVGLTNSMKDAEVVLTKVSADNTNKPIRGTKFIVVEIARDDEGTDKVSPDFRVAHNAGAWNPSNENVNKTILDVAQRDQSGALKVYESSANGTFTVNNLKPGKRYFLFEYEPTAGYEAVSSPWILDVSASGRVSVLAIDPNAELGGNSAINKVKRNPIKAGETEKNYLDDFAVKDGSMTSHNNAKNSVYRTYWPTDWFYNTTNGGKTIGTAKNPINDNDKKLLNNVADIKILKTAKDETTPVQGAKFAFTDVSLDSNRKLEFGSGGMIKRSENDANAIVVESNQQGEINLKDIIKGLRATSNGKVQGYQIDANEINLLMFEVEAPGVYKKDTSPWMITITREGTVIIKEYKDRNAYGQESPITATGSWRQGAPNYSGLVKIDDFTEISRSTLQKAANVTNDTNSYEVEKVDFADESIPVNGAEFDLYKVDDEQTDIGLIDKLPHGRFQISNATPINGNTKLVSSNGKITLPITEQGAYLLFETSAPSGYVRSLAPWGIYVDSNNNIKTYRINDNSLESVIARITDDNGNLISNITSIYVDCNEMNVPGKIANKKFDVELNKTNLSGSPIDGAKFELYKVTTLAQNETVDSLIDANWATKFAGNSDWHMEQLEANKVGANKEIESKDGGKVSLPIEEEGVYLLFEKSAAPNYKLPTEPWVLVVSDYGKVVVRKSSGNAKEGERWWKASKYTKIDGLSITNERLIEITKVNSMNSSKPVVGAKFVLNRVGDGNDYFVAGTRSQSPDNQKNTSILATNSSLKVTVDGKTTFETNAQGKISFTAPAPGKYFLFETDVPKGYNLAKSPWLIEVTDDYDVTVKAINPNQYGQYKDKSGKLQSVGDNRDPLLVYNTWWAKSWYNDSQSNTTITNEPVTLNKIGDNDEKLANAVFRIYTTKANLNGNYVESVTKKDDLGLFTSDENGKIDISGLYDYLITNPSYNYTRFLVYEETAPIGYKAPKAPWLLTINNNTYEPLIWSNYYPDYEYGDTISNSYFVCGGSVTIRNTKEEGFLYKVDADSPTHTIDGAKFEIYSVKVKTKKVWVEGYYYYNYYYNGYYVDEDDTEGGKKIIQRNRLLKTVTSKNGGKIDFSGITLPTSGYLLMYETEAADGYAKPYTPWVIEIRNGKIYDIQKCSTPYADGYVNHTANTWWKLKDFETTNSKNTVTNQKIYELPSAGGMGTYWFMIIGAMMMGFALTAGFTKMDLLKLLRR